MTQVCFVTPEVAEFTLMHWIIKAALSFIKWRPREMEIHLFYDHSICLRSKCVPS